MLAQFKIKMSALPHKQDYGLDTNNENREIIANLPNGPPLRARSLNLYSLGPPDTPHPQRSTTVRRKKPSGPNPFSEQVSKNESGSGSGSQKGTQLNQPFWKFHVLRFGTCLYLTTNPTLRHLHCRNAPGYFVNISKKPLGYSMVFEDIETGEPLVKVEKVSDRRSDYFRFQVKKHRFIREGHVISTIEPAMDPVATADLYPGPSIYKRPFSREKESGTTELLGIDWLDAFLGTLLREPIPQTLLPITPQVPMSNYTSKMIDGQKWCVGSLPRYRESRLNPNDTKYIAKKNVYFHRCFEDLSRYFEWEVPPALAVYRECESASKKRAMRHFNRLLKIGPHSSSKQPMSLETEVSPFTEINSYYKCGDGVYFDKAPTDDEPDHHHKLGWITVYDDPNEFVQHGMFDLVVALTLAIGYERNLAFGDSGH